MKIVEGIKKSCFVLLAFILIGIGLNKALTLYEKHKYQPLGTMVKVNNQNMHVYIQGEGKNTIVLMSGLGTAAPVLDFEPLINVLAQNNKVVVVEPFGYGWSDQTNTQRSVQNIIEELRTALKECGITEKVVLMPHSVSGIYAMYYANTYPEEVSSVIGIDCTLPKMCHYFNEEPPTLPSLLQYLSPLGITRLYLTFNPEIAYPTSGIQNYSQQNLQTTKTITTWQIYNKNIIMEAESLPANINTTYDMEFPKELPVLIFTVDSPKTSADGKTKESFYNTYLDTLTRSKLIFLTGTHYLHNTCSQEMSEEINTFLQGN